MIRALETVVLLQCPAAQPQATGRPGRPPTATATPYCPQVSLARNSLDFAISQ